MEPMWIRDSDVLDFEPGHAEIVSSYVRAFFIGTHYEHGEDWIDALNVTPPVPQKSLDEHCRELAGQLVYKHPAISIYRGIFGGIPHIAAGRLSFVDVVGYLSVL